MIASDLKQIIERNAGEISSIAGIAKALHVDRHTVSAWLCGVPYLEVGRSRRFLASDVAKKIIQLRKI